MRLRDVPGPMLIIAGSGMCTGGRIVGHLQEHLPIDSTTLLFVGFQAPGTRNHKRSLRSRLAANWPVVALLAADRLGCNKVQTISFSPSKVLPLCGSETQLGLRLVDPIQRRKVHLNKHVALGVAAAFISVCAGAMASARNESVEVRPIIQTNRSEDPFHVCDAEGDVESELEASAIVTRDGRQSLVVEVTSKAKKDGLALAHSVAVYDEWGQEYVPPEIGKKEKASRTGTSKTFELPPGLPDGNYYAELLTAHGALLGKESTVAANRLYFTVDAGEIEVVEAAEFAALMNAQEAMPGEGAQ